MLVQAGYATTLVGAPLCAPITLPILMVALFVIGVHQWLTRLALRTKSNVHSEMRVKPWSITFALDARNGVCKVPSDEKNEPASKDDESASKP